MTIDFGHFRDARIHDLAVCDEQCDWKQQIAEVLFVAKSGVFLSQIFV